jgi:hypothetical protein
MPSISTLLIGVLVLGLSALSVWYGVEGALASSGKEGTPGEMAIRTCFHGRWPSCVGTFTPDDPHVAAVQTTEISSLYTPGTIVPVQLLYGQAWSTHQSGLPDWLAFVILGIGLTVMYSVALIAGAYWRAVDRDRPLYPVPQRPRAAGARHARRHPGAHSCRPLDAGGHRAPH